MTMNPDEGLEILREWHRRVPVAYLKAATNGFQGLPSMKYDKDVTIVEVSADHDDGPLRVILAVGGDAYPIDMSGATISQTGDGLSIKKGSEALFLRT